jgi:uncharacterized protein (TIGR02145 family)
MKQKFYITFILLSLLPWNDVLCQIRWAQTNVDVSSPSGFATTPSDYGSFFQWNRRTAWNNGTALKTWNIAASGSGAWQTAAWDDTWAVGPIWEAVNDPCPVGWRVPTQAEFQSLLAASDVGSDGQSGQWITAAQANALGIGVNAGRLFGKGIYPIPVRYNPVDMVFFPAGGLRLFTRGGLANQGTIGYYWSNTPFGRANAWYLRFNSDLANVLNSYRGRGFLVRCVRK